LSATPLAISVRGYQMPLTWDITEVVDFVDIKEGAEWSKTEALIFSTMSIGFCTITDTNANEFYARVKMLEGAIGSFVYINGDDYFFTPADIQRRIGLRTNGGSETRTKFLGRMLRNTMADYDRLTKVAVNA
jgi:hypothetical protein